MVAKVTAAELRRLVDRGCVLAEHVPKYIFIVYVLRILGDVRIFTGVMQVFQHFFFQRFTKSSGDWCAVLLR